jgi:hypothetical protein
VSRWRTGRCGDTQGKAQPKTAAGTDIAFDPKGAAHRLGQTPRDGQAKARAARGAAIGWIEHHEIIKHTVKIGL